VSILSQKGFLLRILVFLFKYVKVSVKSENSIILVVFLILAPFRKLILLIISEDMKKR
jgi:hypothetical protein